MGKMRPAGPAAPEGIRGCRCPEHCRGRVRSCVRIRVCVHARAHTCARACVCACVPAYECVGVRLRGRGQTQQSSPGNGRFAGWVRGGQ